MGARDRHKRRTAGRRAPRRIPQTPRIRGWGGRGLVFLLAFIGGVATGPDPQARAAEPTRGRLCFWVPPDQMAAFGEAYREGILPVLADHGLADSATLCALQDEAGTMWFGTMAGVSRYDPQAAREEVWTSFGPSDGLAGNWVLDMVQGRNGRLWVGVVGGVSQYDGTLFQTLTRRDGLAENGVTDLPVDRSGDLWISTASGGVTRYRSPACLLPRPHIDAVVAGKRHEDPAEVSLSTDVDLVSIEFGAVCYCTRPEGMVYRYRLIGLDENWKTTRERRIEYSGLPMGGYTFELGAVDRDLAYSEAPATVRLTVHLPYGTMALYGSLVIAVALVVWQTGRAVRRGRRLRQSNEELRREMAERERAEADRARLDAQLEQLQYLYRLRSVLSEARTGDDAIRKGGEVAMEALSAMAAAGLAVEMAGRSWECGEPALDICRERPLERGGQARRRMRVFCGTGMQETQACALLNETAA